MRSVHNSNYFSRILGTGAFLPCNRVTNHEFALWLKKQYGVHTSNEWIESRTGITARHFADPGQMTSDLAAKAAHAAIISADIDPQTIDLIIVATSTPDQIFPSTACLLQKKINIINCCAAFDIQAVCSGFIYALSTADAMLKSGVYQRVLVVGAEVFSRLLNYSDRSTCVLFGDGAGAVILERSDCPGILANILHADGKYADILQVPANIHQFNYGFVQQTHNIEQLSKQNGCYIYMDGSQVFKLAVHVLSAVAKEVLDLVEMTVQEIDWLIPHQANVRIMQALCKKLNLPIDKMILTVSEHANTSAASIPMALDCAVKDGRIQRDHCILLTGVGGGLTWGATILRF